jgi:hypothetical protein
MTKQEDKQRQKQTQIPFGNDKTRRNDNQEGQATAEADSLRE